MGLPILIGFMIALLALAVGTGYEQLAEIRDRRRFPPPGRLLEVGGHRLHLYALGERQPGQPVVIFEAGMGAWSLGWNQVQSEVARFARAVAWDRAGLGWSESGPLPRTPEQIVGELHALLEVAGERPPYVLVGHSLGGITARLFAAGHPDEVVGMVLADPVHEDMLRQVEMQHNQYARTFRRWRILPTLSRLGLVRLVTQLRGAGQLTTPRTSEERALYLALVSRPQYFETTIAEMRGVFGRPGEMIGQLGAAGGLGAMPLVVIQPGYGEESGRAATPQQRENIRLMAQGQEKVAALSSWGKMVAAKNSWHNIPSEAPGVVIAAIREVVEAVSQR